MILHVCLKQPLVQLGLGSVKIGGGSSPGVAPMRAGRFIEPIKAGGAADPNPHLVRAAHLQSPLSGAQRAAQLVNLDPRRKPDALCLVVFHPVAPIEARVHVHGGLARQHHVRSVLHPRLVAQQAVHSQAERQGPRLICLKADRQQLVGSAHKRLSGVGHAVDPVHRRGQSLLQIQLTPVLVGSAPVVKAQTQVSQRHVRLGKRSLELAAQLAGPAIVLRFQGRADLWQHVPRPGNDTLLGGARPERIVIQLDPFFADTTVHHGSQTAIAERQRLSKAGRGLCIPQSHIVHAVTPPTGQDAPVCAPIRSEAPGPGSSRRPSSS